MRAFLDTLASTCLDTFAADCAQRCSKHAGVVHARRHVGGPASRAHRGMCGVTCWLPWHAQRLRSHVHAPSCRNIHNALALKQNSAQTCRCCLHTCLKTCALNLCTCFERQVVDTFVDMFVDTFVDMFSYWSCRIHRVLCRCKLMSTRHHFIPVSSLCRHICRHA